MMESSLNDILQAAGVAIALIFAIAWIIVRIFRKRPANDCCDHDDIPCAGCPLAQNCTKTKS